ncbi:MAG: hypothetical protein ABSG67_18985 [Thermoguttaceae bacterium]|jgi:hypothetical protein
MSKAAIHGTATLPANFTDLATLFGLSANTLFKGNLTFPAANQASAYMKATTGNGSTDVTVAAGESHDYSAVDLSTVFVKGTSPDTVVLVGEHVESSITFAE